MKGKGKKKPQILTRAVEDKMLSKFMVLVLAYLMEEEMFEGDADKLMDFYESMLRWWGAVKGNELSIQKVCRLIEERTGRRVIW